MPVGPLLRCEQWALLGQQPGGQSMRPGLEGALCSSKAMAWSRWLRDYVWGGAPTLRGRLPKVRMWPLAVPGVWG